MARGLCSPHYKRWYRYGDPTAGQPLRTPRPETCEAEGCERKTDRLKWCGKHYMRLLRHGDPLGGRDRLPAPASCIREGCRSEERRVGKECRGGGGRGRERKRG